MLPYRLLTTDDANPKMKKNQALGFITAGLTLAPARQLDPNLNLCPAHSPGCAQACLFWSGRGSMSRTRNARLQRTAHWRDHPEWFLKSLRADLEALIINATDVGMKPACRLNVTSDIAWEQFRIPDEFPTIQFYDYTKRRDRKVKTDNYHLTFSRSELNHRLVVPTLQLGQNVSVVFRNELPKEYAGYPVIDGDLHDCRWLDPTPTIVGLRAKGPRGQVDTTGFVVSPS